MPNTLEELEIIVKANIESARSQLEELKSQIIDTKSSISDSMGDITSSVGDDSEQIKEQLSSVTTIIAKVGGTTSATAKTIGTAVASTVVPAMEEGSVAVEGMSTSVVAFGTALKSAFPILLAISAVIIVLMKVIRKSKEENEKLRKYIIKFFEPFLEGLKKGISTLANFISKEFSKIKNTVANLAKTGLGNLVQVSTSLNDALSRLQGSTIQLSNALASTLAPIIELITPLILSFLNAIINVVNTLAQITASLFGNQKQYKKAKTVITDYKKSVEGATKANNGLLASFDELEVIKEDSGSGDGVLTPIQDMFSLETIEDKILEITKKLKELNAEIEIKVKLGDFRGAGKTLAKALKKEIDKIKTDELGAKLTEKFNHALEFVNGFLEGDPGGTLGKSIGKFIASAIDTITPVEIGKLIANVVNNAFSLVYQFADEIQMKDGFVKLGEKIATNLVSLIKSLDTETIANAINTLVIGLLDLGLSFFETWNEEGGGSELSSKMDDLFERIEWKEILTKMANLAFKAWWELEEIKLRFKLAVMKAQALFIGDVISDGVSWIKEGFKTYLKETEIGGTSLFDHLKNTWEEVKIWWKTNVGKYFTSEFWRDYFSDTGNGMKQGIKNVINKIIEVIEKGVNKTIRAFNNTFGDLWTISEVKIPRLEDGGVLTKPTAVIAGEYPGAKSNPEIVAPQSLMLETNMKANIPVMNAIEEMTDTLVDAFKNVGVYAEFDYNKLRVGLNNSNYRAGEKLYGV